MQMDDGDKVSTEPTDEKAPSTSSDSSTRDCVYARDFNAALLVVRRALTELVERQTVGACDALENQKQDEAVACASTKRNTRGG